MQVLFDFIKLDKFFDLNPNFYRLGIIHKLVQDDRVLVKLAESLNFIQPSGVILKRFARCTLVSIKKFVRVFVHEGSKLLDFKHIKCITARQLSKSEIQKLRAELEAIFGVNRFNLTPLVSNKILGGSILELDSLRFDNSYAEFIKNLEKECIDRRFS